MHHIKLVQLRIHVALSKKKEDTWLDFAYHAMSTSNTINFSKTLLTALKY